jgi:hypothetical protein
MKEVLKLLSGIIGHVWFEIIFPFVMDFVEADFSFMSCAVWIGLFLGLVLGCIFI